MALPPLVLQPATAKDATTVSAHKVGANGCRKNATKPPLRSAFAHPRREPSGRLPR
jgi:hypothetical protein